MEFGREGELVGAPEVDREDDLRAQELIEQNVALVANIEELFG